MIILVINSGSSSIKYKLFEDEVEIFGGLKEQVVSFDDSLDQIFDELVAKKIILSLNSIDVVGHRVVHGANKFYQATIIDDNVIDTIEQLIPLAPLHNMVNLKAIKIIQNQYPNIKQVAVFDTAFHQTMPQSSYIYAIKKDLYEKYNIRKYGFHGISHNFVSQQAAKILKKDITKCNLITLHIGNGASITAIKDGKSYDTSMGFTPLDGLVMGSRSGSIDPSILIYMQKTLGYSVEQIDDILNKQSGLLGLCGCSDMREILQKVEQNDKDSILAIDIFIKRIVEYIAKYLVLLQKVDAIVFTGGIGEHSSYIREKVISYFSIYDIYLDTTKSKIPIFTIATDEQKAIALEIKKLNFI